ncbi:MAG: hypothetical protein WC860_09720, partial [Candidatus Margulisiibacteriota bacterium]
MGLIKKRILWLTISGLLVIVAIVFLSLWKLNLGLDFTGGTLMELEFKQKVSSSQIEKVLDKNEVKGYTIQKTADKSYFIKFSNVSKGKVDQIKKDIKNQIGNSTEKKFENVGPSVSKDLANRSYWSIGIASLFIILYIAYAFRKIPKPANSYRFGVSAVIALIHDCILVIGLFAFLGHFYGVE